VAYKEIPRIPRKQKELDLLSYEHFSSIIIKNLKIFSQNVRKNKTLIKLILET